MRGNLIGTVIRMKMRLACRLTETLPEPLRSEMSGLKAQAAGCVKELAGFGIDMLTRLSESVRTDFDAADRKTDASAGKKLRKIELD